MPSGGSPIARGVSYALLAALSFGLTIPILAIGERGVGPLSTAALLYFGAALSAIPFARRASSSGAPLRRAHFGRLLAVALFGAALAPTLLAWGLAHSSASSGALLLNLEALFTALFAWVLYREAIGRRVTVALTAMALGGVVLTLGAAGAGGGRASTLGAVAIVGATAAWALDNALTRGLSELDPLRVVAGKGLLGAVMTGALALLLREPLPMLFSAGILLACGATGFGLSLRLYLLAQRRIGAARTGSIFAIAPFIGAAAAFATFGRLPTLFTLAAAALFGLGVWLHASERHAHAHLHPAMEHEHVHRHDDGHHDHLHVPPFLGEHSHLHRHELVTHEHEHAPDLHHRHRHERQERAIEDRQK